MHRRFFGILVILLMVLSNVILARADSMNVGEAMLRMKEYRMEFDKYSAQTVYNIALNEHHPAYPYLTFYAPDENAPLDEYEIGFAVYPESNTLIFQSTTKGYTEPIYVFFYFYGWGDIAYPCLQVRGKDIVGVPVKKLVWRCADTQYVIEYHDHTFSFITDGMFIANCDTMFEMEIDLLSEIADNAMKVQLEITFDNGRTIQTELTSIPDVNMGTYFLQALTEAKYIDAEGNIQADIAVHFPTIREAYQPHITVVNSKNRNDKGYSLFGEKYGLTLTTAGETGVYGSSTPWFSATVRNEHPNKTVDGFDFVYYATNVYGDIIEINRDNGTLLYYTVVKDIRPGQEYSTERISFTSSSSQKAKVIYVAIRRIHFSDGSLVEIPLRDLVFYKYLITY